MFIRVFFFFKQKTAYEMRISDWSSDVCSSDLTVILDRFDQFFAQRTDLAGGAEGAVAHVAPGAPGDLADLRRRQAAPAAAVELLQLGEGHVVDIEVESHADGVGGDQVVDRSEEQTSELQSLMRISYADFCLKKKK